jgi:hypothetical protein
MNATYRRNRWLIFLGLLATLFGVVLSFLTAIPFAFLDMQTVCQYILIGGSVVACLMIMTGLQSRSRRVREARSLAAKLAEQEYMQPEQQNRGNTFAMGHAPSGLDPPQVLQESLPADLWAEDAAIRSAQGIGLVVPHKLAVGHCESRLRLLSAEGGIRPGVYAGLDWKIYER